MPPIIRLGISTCPNDTFAFHGLLNRLVDWRDLEFRIELLDIQQLNDRLFANQFDVAKASFFAALQLAGKTWVMPSGSALGYGVGPLLLAAREGTRPSDPQQLTLCPGHLTTATMLFSMFYPETTRLEQCVFSDIMPRLQRHQADFGVCIHEGRFTWKQQGLGLVEDLGSRWETSTGRPLPLGGLIASRDLDVALLKRVQDVIRDSIELAINDPAAAIPTMRLHAQEFDDQVLMQHVDLYVNEWTVELGDVGRDALTCLSREAQSAGLIDANAPPLEILPLSD